MNSLFLEKKGGFVQYSCDIHIVVILQKRC